MSLVESGRIPVWELLPAAAQADYREYLRQGGRYDVAVWWERYKDCYRKAES